MYHFFAFCGFFGLVGCGAVALYQWGRLAEQKSRPSRWELLQRDLCSLN